MLRLNSVLTFAICARILQFSAATLCVQLTLLMNSVAAAEEQSAESWGVVTGSHVNVRAGPALMVLTPKWSDNRDWIVPFSGGPEYGWQERECCEASADRGFAGTGHDDGGSGSPCRHDAADLTIAGVSCTAAWAVRNSSAKGA